LTTGYVFYNPADNSTNQYFILGSNYTYTIQNLGYQPSISSTSSGVWAIISH
jgi:hypothetical protein